MSFQEYLNNLEEYPKLLDRYSYDMNDGNWSDYRDPVKFPAYIRVNDFYPFLFNPSLTTIVDGKISNQYSPADSFEKFADSLANQSIDWKYRNKIVTYDVNSSGYRTAEWETIDWKNSIVIFGCSCVYGVGLANDETIDYYLEKETGIPTVNMGFPSGSNDHILINILNLLDYVGEENFPKNIVIGWTTTDRFAFFGERGVHPVGPWDSRKHQPFYPQYIAMFEDRYNQYMRSYYIAKTVRALLKNKTNLIEFSFFPESTYYMRLPGPPIKMIDKARDIIHPGNETSKLVVEYLKDKIHV